MKKTLVVITTFILLISCQKTDIGNKGLSGTEWIGQAKTSGSTTTGTTYTEYKTVKDVTLRFSTETSGSIYIITVTTTDGIKGSEIRENYNFTYTYDKDYMNGSIRYNVPDFDLYRTESTFEIRSGFLYEISDLIGEIEYRKK